MWAIAQIMLGLFFLPHRQTEDPPRHLASQIRWDAIRRAVSHSHQQALRTEPWFTEAFGLLDASWNHQAVCDKKQWRCLRRQIYNPISVYLTVYLIPRQHRTPASGWIRALIACRNLSLHHVADRSVDEFSLTAALTRLSFMRSGYRLSFL